MRTIGHFSRFVLESLRRGWNGLRPKTMNQVMIAFRGMRDEMTESGSLTPYLERWGLTSFEYEAALYYVQSGYRLDAALELAEDDALHDPYNTCRKVQEILLRWGAVYKLEPQHGNNTKVVM